MALWGLYENIWKEGKIMADKLKELEEKLTMKYAELGKLYYKDQVTKDTPDIDHYKQLFEDIKGIKKDVFKEKDAELKAKGLKMCPRCKVTVTIESIYCNMCGFKFDNEEIEETPVEEKRVCKYCKAELDDDAVFCSNCGKKN